MQNHLFRLVRPNAVTMPLIKGVPETGVAKAIPIQTRSQREGVCNRNLHRKGESLAVAWQGAEVAFEVHWAAVQPELSRRLVAQRLHIAIAVLGHTLEKFGNIDGD